MTDFSYAQLEGLWTQAGGSSKLAPIMAAIAMAESGGNSQAHNPSGASGLWQILGNPFPGDAFDPLTNAKMAVAKWKSQGLGAWTTYTSGAYKQFLKKGVSPGKVQTTAASQKQQGGPGGGLSEAWKILAPGSGLVLPWITGTATSVGDVGAAVSNLDHTLGTFMTWMQWLFVPSHWIRIICFIGGVPMVGMGLIVMTVGSKPVPVSAGPVSVPVSGGSIAPAIGIAQVTFGSVLLFIAFHNLPESVKTFPDLLSYMQTKIPVGNTKTPTQVQ